MLNRKEKLRSHQLRSYGGENMSRTAFTASEWAEFCDGFDDPDDAWEVACSIWTKERRSDLQAIRKFCEKEHKKYLDKNA